MILKMHVGRFILGLPDPVDRARFLDSSQPERDPQHLIDGYELLIEEALQGTSKCTEGDIRIIQSAYASP